MMKEPSPAKSTRSAHGTTHTRVYTELKSALMNGDFVPGQRLVVRQLAERLETSPMPVREALRRLVSDEALFDHPNKGVIVPDATVELILDLVRVRSSIEGAAAEWAATTILPDELDMIIGLNDAMKECAVKGETANYLVLNRQFHFAIYRAARSAVLQPVIERLWLRAGPWLNIMRGEATLGQGLDHHAEILEGLRTADGPMARRALVADIADAADIMLRAASGSPIVSRTERGSAAPRRFASAAGAR